MPLELPPHLAAAFEELEHAIEGVEGRKVDLLTTPWAEIEKSVIKLLKGAFTPNKPEHQMLSLGVSVAFAQRLEKEIPCFYFLNRESAEGVSLGFSEAVVTLSPFTAATESLLLANLPRLDDVARELRAAIGRVKFSGSGAAPQRLTRDDYQRLFDPGFVRFLAIDPKKIDAAFAMTPGRLGMEIKEALGRAGSRLPADAKKQMELQLVGALSRLDGNSPVVGQIEKAPRVGELIVSLWGTTKSTGAAAEELWQDVLVPLLLIGTPEKFPNVEPDELAAVAQGVDPFLLMLETVPFSTPAPDEQGLLGAIPADKLTVVHPAFLKAGPARMIQVNLDSLKPALDAFDANKTKEFVKRYFAHVKAALGGKGPDAPAGTAQNVFDAAMIMLTELKAASAAGVSMCMQRQTEMEAHSEGALAELRSALSGPRIILA